MYKWWNNKYSSFKEFNNNTILFWKRTALLIIIKKICSNPRCFQIRTTLSCFIGSKKNTLIKNLSESNGEVLNIAVEK